MGLSCVDDGEYSYISKIELPQNNVTTKHFPSFLFQNFTYLSTLYFRNTFEFSPTFTDIFDLLLVYLDENKYFEE